MIQGRGNLRVVHRHVALSKKSAGTVTAPGSKVSRQQTNVTNTQQNNRNTETLACEKLEIKKSDKMFVNKHKA